MKTQEINSIGVWSLRLILLIGAVVGGFADNEAVSSSCLIGLVCSFLFLD